MCPNTTQVTFPLPDSKESEEVFEFVTDASSTLLNHRQLVDYNEHRKKLIAWLETRGKNPQKHKGYAPSTIANYAHRLDKFYRWVWQEYDGYTTQITHEHANDYIQALSRDVLHKDDGSPYSGNHKRKTANAIETLFEWRARERNAEQWSPDVEFSEKTQSQADPFSKAERRLLRETSLEYGTIPKYNDLSPEERDQWKAYLAQKLGKSKDEISPEDWTRVNRSWKIPSIILTAFDTGLRPVGMHRASLDWLRLDKGVLSVPPEDIVKDGKQCEIALTDRTVEVLKRWQKERENYPKYDDSDALWLNRNGNRYNSNTLNYLLNNLCEEAGINQEGRNISWYSIRHSVGTYLASEGNLAEAQAQLRHENPETTMKYTEPPPEERRKTLDRI